MPNRLEPATRHYDEKLQEILKTSAKIFAEKGFHHTSVRDISRATKMSLSGLYYYFTTKEELLYLIQERCFVTLLQRWEQAQDPALDVRARIRCFAENHLSFFLHNMEMELSGLRISCATVAAKLPSSESRSLRWISSSRERIFCRWRR